MDVKSTVRRQETGARTLEAWEGAPLFWGHVLDTTHASRGMVSS
jgi:hypothetical protein